MIDFELFDKILKTMRPPPPITTEDYLSNDTVSWLRDNVIPSEMCLLFAPVIGTSLYTIEVPCHLCGRLFDKKMKKVGVSRYLCDDYSEWIPRRQIWVYHIICPECEVSEKKQGAVDPELIAEKKVPVAVRCSLEEVKDREERTQKYCNETLNPEFTWKKDCSYQDRWSEVAYSDVGYNEIAEYIKKLSYSDFLQTPYWKAVANRVRYNASFKCQFCNGNGEVHVHHKTYEHHGREHKYLEDLVCLCKDCHEVFTRERQHVI